MSTEPTTEPKTSLRPLIITVVLVLAAVGLLYVMSLDKLPPEGMRAGNTCPEIAGLDAEGKPIKLSEYRGKVVLVSFWATWCPPCRKLLPHEREMVTVKYKDRPFVLLGVAADAPDTLKGFLKTNPMPWPNIADDQGVIGKQWQVDSIPSAVLVDHEGVIRRTWIGNGLDPGEVWYAVDPLVVDAEKK
ncbi:MAG TPA: TlpA disulfide reductase family protein [Gemmataceae bacterium]|jgi:peroxiredoxin|nr:TlpA disulfide reductase family protein [Gemmataceae bacterium]